MNVSTIASLVIGFACIIISIATRGHLKDYFDPASIFIVFGGVICATVASYSMPRIKSLFKALKVAFSENKIDYDRDIDTIVDIANVARRNGLLALEELTDNMDEPFLKKGILLVVDGSNPELIRSILETELSVTKERHAKNRAILETAATYSPAFGMIGTLIGLINMLRNLDDLDSLGPNMAVALVTTFYGTMLANLVFNPLSKRLRTVGEVEYLHKELIIEGIMAIQNGENPRIIREKLNAYLSNAQQQNNSAREYSKSV
ncbi:MAG TPA: motility protein A [Clostridiales bacterium]|jgi:chemotaxis protein MotA|nr:motility protein A [Clostridiales bacterium]